MLSLHSTTAVQAPNYAACTVLCLSAAAAPALSLHLVCLAGGGSA